MQRKNRRLREGRKALFEIKVKKNDIQKPQYKLIPVQGRLFLTEAAWWTGTRPEPRSSRPAAVRPIVVDGLRAATTRNHHIVASK
jgi:hypothetical protein